MTPGFSACKISWRGDRGGVCRRGVLPGYAALRRHPAGDRFDSGFDFGTGYGLIRAFKAICQIVPCPTAQASLGDASPREAVEIQGELPTEFAFDQNYPNLFNPQTLIEFALPETREVELAVFDVMGRRVATLVNGVLAAGFHEVTWDAKNLPTGVYLYRITAGDFVQIKQMMLVK